MKKRELAQKLSKTLDLPGEALGEPCLSVWSDRSLRVDHHGGVLQWSDRELSLRWGAGLLHVTGRGLRIRAMEEESLALEGKIISLEWRD